MFSLFYCIVKKSMSADSDVGSSLDPFPTSEARMKGALMSSRGGTTLYGSSSLSKSLTTFIFGRALDP